MRKQAWIVNLLLIAAAVVLTMKLRGDWQRANQRYATLNAPVTPKLGASMQPGAAAVAGSPSLADSIVANNLFTPDRNNTVAPLAVKVEAAPPLPVFVGAMDIGNGPLAFMAEAATPASTKPVKVGQMIGGYKLASVGSNFVMVEYEGQQKRLDVSTAPVNRGAVAGVTPPEPARSIQPTLATPANAHADIITGKPTPANPSGNSTGNAETRSSFDMFGANGKDTYAAGAVVDGWKKVEHPWPFGGKQVWWEKVKQ